MSKRREAIEREPSLARRFFSFCIFLANDIFILAFISPISDSPQKLQKSQLKITKTTEIVKKRPRCYPWAKS